MSLAEAAAEASAEVQRYLDDKNTVRVEVGTTVDEAERRLILLTLDHMHNNKTRAAEVLGISLKTFGIVFACGFLAAGAILVRRLREIGKPVDYAYEMALAALVGGLVGSRARVVPGGAPRTASSWAGLDALRGHGLVAIHDAARPFASPSLFATVAAVATEYGSAVPGLAIAETVRRADDAGRAVQEVDRNGLWTAQTPQAFQRALLERARRSAGDRSFTDEAAAIIAMDEDVRLVPGERRNFRRYAPEARPCGRRATVRRSLSVR